MGTPALSIDLSPRHLQLRDMLFRRWKTNGVKVGDKIESQNEIVKFCEFSLITVIKTLKDLEAEGIIRRQVGKGSFLVKTPWSEAHHRVGFFYNRDIVGGGIFNNDFYTKLVVAFEKGVVSDGHEFILGSFTHKSMPIHMWDALDVVVLTGITKETRLERLAETSSQVAIIDLILPGLPYHSYRIDFEPAFQQMFKKYDGKRQKYLYLNSTISSSEQTARLEAFKRACAASKVQQELKVISVNQETGAEDTAELEAALASYQPDFVCGYLHHSWVPLIAARAKKPAKVYPFSLDSDRPSFQVKSAEWMQQVLTNIYANLEDRKAGAQVFSFPATFRP
jgi:hypothetical protein